MIDAPTDAIAAARSNLVAIFASPTKSRSQKIRVRAAYGLLRAAYRNALFATPAAVLPSEWPDATQASDDEIRAWLFDVVEDEISDALRVVGQS